MENYELYVCLQKSVYESQVPDVLQPKLGWKVLADDLPTDANTVVEIKAFLDSKSISYSSGDVKEELLELVNNTPTEDHTPTWEQSALYGNLGVPRVSLDGNLIIIKGAFSMLDGELTAISDLGSGLQYPNNSILTKSEAQTLANGNLFSDVG